MGNQGAPGLYSYQSRFALGGAMLGTGIGQFGRGEFYANSILGGAFAPEFSKEANQYRMQAQALFASLPNTMYGGNKTASELMARTTGANQFKNQYEAKFATGVMGNLLNTDIASQLGTVGRASTFIDQVNQSVPALMARGMDERQAGSLLYGLTIAGTKPSGLAAAAEQAGKAIGVVGPEVYSASLASNTRLSEAARRAGVSEVEPGAAARIAATAGYAGNALLASGTIRTFSKEEQLRVIDTLQRLAMAQGKSSIDQRDLQTAFLGTYGNEVKNANFANVMNRARVSEAVGDYSAQQSQARMEQFKGFEERFSSVGGFLRNSAFTRDAYNSFRRASGFSLFREPTGDRFPALFSSGIDSSAMTAYNSSRLGLGPDALGLIDQAGAAMSSGDPNLISMGRDFERRASFGQALKAGVGSLSALMGSGSISDAYYKTLGGYSPGAMAAGAQGDRARAQMAGDLSSLNTSYTGRLTGMGIKNPGSVGGIIQYIGMVKVGKIDAANDLLSRNPELADAVRDQHVMDSLIPSSKDSSEKAKAKSAAFASLISGYSAVTKKRLGLFIVSNPMLTLSTAAAEPGISEATRKTLEQARDEGLYSNIATHTLRDPMAQADISRAKIKSMIMDDKSGSGWAALSLGASDAMQAGAPVVPPEITASKTGQGSLSSLLNSASDSLKNAASAAKALESGGSTRGSR